MISSMSLKRVRNKALLNTILRRPSFMRGPEMLNVHSSSRRITVTTPRMHHIGAYRFGHGYNAFQLLAATYISHPQ